MKIGTALSATVGTFTVFDDEGHTEVVPLPSGVSTSVGTNPDFVPWHRGNISRTYVLGGHSNNMVFTEHKWLLPMGIRPPSCEMVLGAGSGNKCGVAVGSVGGLEGECSFALRWLDSLHHRRSPLGMGSPAITLTDQGIALTNVPLRPFPMDPCVDKVEIWVSVDGGLFRNWDTRDIGVANFGVNGSATGEAYSEVSAMPKVRFGDVANDRLFAAGDPAHRDRIYASALGRFEEYEGLYLTTRGGEPAIGIKNIGGTIYVQCPNSSYYIQGFGASDITMRLLKANIGGFGQRSIVKLDDIALVPTQRGWYRCDGSSMIPIGVGDWDETWRNTVSDTDRRPNYEDGFVVADYVSGVVRFLPRRILAAGEAVDPLIIGFPESSEDSFDNTYWVVNFAGLVPELGGSGRADLSFDQYVTDDHTCASMLYDPDAAVGAFYTGTVTGDVMIENQAHYVDRIADAPTVLTFILHTSHDRIGPVASDEDAFQVTDIWANLQCDQFDSTLGIYCGSEFAWQSGAPSTSASPTDAWAPIEVVTLRAGAAYPPGVDDDYVDNYFVPQDKWPVQSLANSSGSSISIRITMAQNGDNLPGGGLVYQRAEMVFTGWGYVAQPGVDRRPIAPYIP